MGTQAKVSLTKPGMILLAMLELSAGTSKNLKFEDIVVKAYEMFPDHFHLRGYVHYPDSGDLVHKPLYTTLKSKGLVRSGNKIFSLTLSGIDVATQWRDELMGKKKVGESRFSRSSLVEIERMKKTEGFQLFLENKENEIVEADLFSHLGANVRMSGKEFEGRMSVIGTALGEILKNDEQEPTLLRLCSYNEFLLKKFPKTVMDFK